jgi:anti-sigma factor RsiW
MNCKNAQHLLSAYLDCELTGTEMARLRRHLSSCDCCRQEETELRTLKSLLTDVPLVEPPADFEERLCALVFAQKRADAEGWNRSWPLVSGVALIAAALTLLLVNHLGMEQPAQSRQSDVVARELQRDQTSLAGANPIMDSSTTVPTGYEGR